MTISYNWLSDYLPERSDPEELSKILTSIGLEVESLEKVEDIKGGLRGLVVGEVLSCEKHPDADKLKLTKVNINNGDALQIVCGASNVAAGQKVIIATIGTTLYPVGGEPFTIKKAKIRGVESQGMICAQDEIGLGADHSGIMVLDPETIPGTSVASLFKPKEDFVYEIGLTPNRIDAMSHLGVARDVCAYLSHHNNKEVKAILPYTTELKADNDSLKMDVSILAQEACKRYSGISIRNIKIAESPAWLQERLKSIGVKPISNIVDITNFILHETGQPLHAFDADKIKGSKIIVRMAAEGEHFVTLDGKERKLLATDLMICNETDGMCIAGVYGGMHSGISHETKNIFIESAWFNPSYIRRTSLKHDLRTDAAARFEKGTDISNTVNVLVRAALLIKEIAGGELASDIIDIYPSPVERKHVSLAYSFLKKLSGKDYTAGTVKNILRNLGFGITKDEQDAVEVAVPYSKPDVTLPADLVEEIMRIDGLDNVEIPASINIVPSVEKNQRQYALKEKLCNYLAGSGFHEIFTNSITNSNFYSEDVLNRSVKMINSLSAELNIMRPEMLQAGLQVIAHNNNRKNFNLRLFEFGKTYAVAETGGYTEKMHLAFYLSGNVQEADWQSKASKADFFYLKGAIENSFSLLGIQGIAYEPVEKDGFDNHTEIRIRNKVVGFMAEVSAKTLKQFDVKTPVFTADLDWSELLAAINQKPVEYKELSKFPAVVRDLSVVVDKKITYAQIKKLASSAGINALKSVQLFDIFESEKLGSGKKAMAVSFTFLDETKTFTDTEIDSFMQKIIGKYEKEISAEIRK